MKYCTLCKAKYDDAVSFCPVDGEVLEDDPTSLVGTVLDGQYQMEAMLGKGGMGAVYSARHILLGDRVAIKVLPPEVRTNAEWLRRFRREGQAARRFRHPNAVTVYDLRTASDGTIYMVMEYVEGHTLDAEVKKRGRFTSAGAYELLAPIMSVLDTAHSMGVVHRDLKPENIMVGRPGADGQPVVKLLDLGIAKMREIAGADTQGNTALTTAGQVLGTPYYMSPEQWGEIPRDGNTEIDGRADIYSLGLVFYEMIAGRRCFSGTTLHELRREHVSRSVKPLIDVVPDVPQAFSDAILRATAKDRGDRQLTAKQLAQELRAALGPDISSSVRRAGGFEDSPVADTVGMGDVKTGSDLNAPTLVAVNPSAISSSALQENAASITPPVVDLAPTISISQTGNGPGSVATSIPATVEEFSSSSRSAAAVPMKAAPRSKAPIVLVALLIVGFIGIALAGGIWFFVRSNSNANESAKTTTTTNTSEKSETVAVSSKEMARYWLELEPQSAKESSTQVAGLVPIASGRSLKLHFIFNENGFLYVIGPGGNTNQPTAFLTNKPFPDSGLKTNDVKAGVPFVFPDGGSQLTLDKRAGTDVFTVVFSKSKLTSPASFDAAVTGQPLKGSEQTELNKFLEKGRQISPSTELNDSNAQAPFVSVKSTSADSANPFVFDIRIQHN